MSIGERIKSARILAGKSQRELAQAVQLSAMAISKYERNMDIPGSAVVIRLAKALHVKVEYFFRPTTVTLSPPAYRGKHTLLEEYEISILAHIQEWLERYCDIENLLDKVPLCKELPKLYVETLDDVEDAVVALRGVWQLGLDPIEGLMEICEDRGIKVGLVEGNEILDALTLWANGTMPVIVLKRDMQGDRQRFSLAHELGYLTLQIAEGIDPEKAANRFAGALLAPKSAVEFELGIRRHTISIYELHMLKHKYGLSMQAWMYRAGELGILSEAAVALMFKQFQQKGWQREEPGDALPAEMPQRFERLVMRASSEGIISQARTAELLGMPLAKFVQGEVERHGGFLVELCG